MHSLLLLLFHLVQTVEVYVTQVIKHRCSLDCMLGLDNNPELVVTVAPGNYRNTPGMGQLVELVVQCVVVVVDDTLVAEAFVPVVKLTSLSHGDGNGLKHT